VFCGMELSERGEFWCENEKGKVKCTCVMVSGEREIHICTYMYIYI